MPLDRLTLISAGAGSGKTYRIQTDIAEWIKNGEVKADKILAVTFTEAAAAELRHRIREQLIEKGFNEQAMQLNQACISTIHGFGLKILTDYCFDGGLAPDSVLLTEEEANSLLRAALTSSDESDEIIQNFAQYGYKYDFNTKKTASDQFRSRVLSVINNLRLIGRDRSDDALLMAAKQYIKDQYGNTKDANVLDKSLHSAVNALLTKFNYSLENTVTVKSAKDDLRNNFKALSRAKDKTKLQSDWPLWVALQKLRISNRNTKLAEGYDDLATDVMEAANNLKFHPGPLEQELKHIEILFKLADKAMKNYSQQKKDAGLLDYTDMLVLADKLLKQPEVLNHIKKRFDCLVIDEFQDTNPMQFSLLRRLQQTGIATLIVGDQKQAIMRFQQADSRLMAALQKQSEIKQESLTENWRTTAGLMSWVNAVGQSLFDDEYIALEAKAAFKSKLSGLEIIEQAKKSKETTHHYYTALRIKAVLENEKSMVFDKKTKEYRRIKASDIAVLHPKSKGLEREGDALRELGIAVRVEEDGWFGSEIIQLLYYALSYVADTSDRHAALYMATSEIGRDQLQSALNVLLDKEDIDDPVLITLADISAASQDKDVSTLLNEVIDCLTVHRYIATKKEGKQARANLIRLIAEANAFVAMNTSTLSSAGIFGSGLKSFLAWLKQLAETEDAQPHAQAVSENAVHMVTWHSSKGREWPVVVVCGLESKVKPRFPHLETEYTSFDDVDNILEHARITNSPEFADTETKESFIDALMPAIKKDAICLLYVALTRAREKIILEWPSHQLATNKAYSYMHVLQGSEESKISLTDQGINIQGTPFNAEIIQCDKDKPEAFEKEINQIDCDFPVEFRASIEEGEATQDLTPDMISPSTLHEEKPEKHISIVGVEVEDLKKSINLTLNIPANEKGTLIHRCLEILNGDEGRKELLSEAIGNQLAESEIQQIVDFSKTFEDWLKEKYKLVSIGREVPIISLDKNNSVITGFIDLLVETEQGYWILDYKTDQTSDFDARYISYKPQLELYAKVVADLNEGKDVLGIGVVWLQTGHVMLEKCKG